MRLMVLASGDLWAGAEVMVYHLCCGLVEQNDIDLLVVLLNHGRLADELDAAGVRTFVVDERKSSAVEIVGRVQRIVGEFSPDVVHSHRYKENGIAWLVTRVRPGVRLVATQHGMPENVHTGRSLRKRMHTNCFFRLLSGGFGRTVCVSHEMQRALDGAFGFQPGSLAVVHNGIDLPPDSEKPQRQKVVVGSAGRFVPVKDYKLLVDVARLAVAECDELEFALAGDGPEFPRIESLVSEYGLQDKFTLFGSVEDMSAFYSNLDIYINTSVHEGIPMSVLEAMAYRLPVVAPDVGGFSEIVDDGSTGYLVDGREARTFVEKIQDLIPHARRHDMGAAARRCAEERFSRQAMAREYIRIYQGLP